MKLILLTAIFGMMAIYCNLQSMNECEELDICYNVSAEELKLFEKGSNDWCTTFKNYFWCVHDSTVLCEIDFCDLQPALLNTRKYCLSYCNNECNIFNDDCPPFDNTTTTESPTTTTETTTTATETTTTATESPTTAAETTTTATESPTTAAETTTTRDTTTTATETIIITTTTEGNRTATTFQENNSVNLNGAPFYVAAIIASTIFGNL